MTDINKEYEKEYYDEYRNNYYNPDDDDAEPGINLNWKRIQKGFHSVAAGDQETAETLSGMQANFETLNTDVETLKTDVDEIKESVDDLNTAVVTAEQAAEAAAASEAAAQAAQAAIKEIAESIPEDYSELSADVDDLKNAFNDLGVIFYNLFDPDNLHVGYYLDGNGGLSENANFATSNFINVEGYESIMFSYTNFGGWYSSDDESGFISPLNTTEMNSLAADKTATVPEGAKYLRVTVQVSNLDVVQVGEKVDRNKYIAHDKIYLRNVLFDTSGEDITVTADGSGDYTSLTEALYENIENGKTVVVKPGTYDVVSEYVALFGQDVVDALADATTGINDFQYGIRIKNRIVIFEPGSKVVCDWTGHTVNGTHRFSAFRVEQGADIRGLYLIATAVFYAIHDDYGPSIPFTVKYDNCHIEGYNIFNANCIGGGCHKYSNHILTNCYFDNHSSSSDIVLSAEVRYHNTNTADAEPEVHVSNCYFAHNMNVAYYGAQTTKMRAYINNCYAPAGINKVRESSSMTTDNVDLYAWNNQTA